MGASQQVISSYGGADAPFSPADIAGLLAWYKADAITGLADNDPVATWPDSSASGFDATAEGGQRPTYKTNELNGKPVVRFDGTSDTMASSYPTSQKPFSVFAVVKATNFDDYRCIIGSFVNTGIEWRLNQTTGNQNMDKQATSGIGTSTVAVAPATWTVISATYSNTGVWAYYFGTTADNSGTQDVAFSATTMILGSASGIHLFLGDMAEIICYDSVLSAPNLVLVQEYLEAKYGL